MPDSMGNALHEEENKGTELRVEGGGFSPRAGNPGERRWENSAFHRRQENRAQRFGSS